MITITLTSYMPKLQSQVTKGKKGVQLAKELAAEFLTSN